MRIKVKKELYLMNIDGADTVVIRIRTLQGSRWFSSKKEEYVSSSHISQIRSQLDDEHRIGVPELYDMISEIETGDGSTGGDYATSADLEAEVQARSSADSALTSAVNAVLSKVDSISVPTNVSDLANDAGYQTAEEVSQAIDEKLQDIGQGEVPTKVSELENDANYVTSEEISSAVTEGVNTAITELKIYNLGNFDTLDSLNVRLADHNYYNNTDRVLYYFTIADTDTGIVINNMGSIVDGYPYRTRQYMYYQEHRYTRTVVRSASTGDVSYTAWIVEDNVTLQGKGVDFYSLSLLGTDASDFDIQAALTFPYGSGVVTLNDLAACEEKGMFLREYNTNAQIIVGRTNVGSNYTLTYVGYPIITANNVDTTKVPVVRSVVLNISNGVYSIVKPAGDEEPLTTAWDKYPLEGKIPLWFMSSGGGTYSESTILGWFGCTSVTELKEKMKNSGLVSMLYLNNDDMYYRIPVQFVEFRDNDNQLHMVTVGVDMTDDSPCRYEITINFDGTVISDEYNVVVVKEKLLRESDISETIADLTARLEVLEST